MNIEEVNEALQAFNRRRPFRPYFVELQSGDRFLVKHPEVVYIRERLIYHVTPQRDYRVFDSSSVCSVLDVVAGPDENQKE